MNAVTNNVQVFVFVISGALDDSYAALTFFCLRPLSFCVTDSSVKRLSRCSSL